MTTVTHQPTKGYRTLRLPLVEQEYDQFVSDNAFAKQRLEQCYGQYPELFPESFKQGYVLYGSTTPSSKLGLRCRRLQVNAGKTVYTVVPGFVMPYMTGNVNDVSNALFFMRFHVPCWAIAEVLGREAMYGYRLEESLGRFSVVGTTVKSAEQLPQDLVGDEKHSWLQGARIYIATTAGNDCLLGAAVSPSASQPDLTQAYGVFATEARDVDSTYAPETVNTDGWQATQGAWKALFPGMSIILCFLHAFLKVRDRATKALAEVFGQAGEKIWHAYEAPTKRGFAQRLRRLKEWAKAVLPESAMKTHTLDLCDKRAQFIDSYDHERAHRTSNMVDRLMKFLDRACFNGQYFHGRLASAERRVRAWALLWNFCPSSPQTVKKYHGQRCPAERLSGKRYAQNWLENLLISGSMNGYQRYQQNPL